MPKKKEFSRPKTDISKFLHGKPKGQKTVR
jgi:hypothetical protein